EAIAAVSPRGSRVHHHAALHELDRPAGQPLVPGVSEAVAVVIVELHAADHHQPEVAEVAAANVRAAAGRDRIRARRHRSGLRPAGLLHLLDGAGTRPYVAEAIAAVSPRGSRV